MTTKTKNKILVGMPIGTDMMKVKTAFSLIHALKGLECEWDFQVYMSGDLIGGRSGLVNKTIKGGFSHLLFVDHDMFFPPDAIQKLLDHKKEVVGAAYNKRKLPLESTAIKLTEITPTDILFKVNALGAGFLLIDVKVFDKIERPFFNFGRTVEGEMVYGEDTYFVQKCVKAGIDVFADPNLQVSHLGEFNY